MLWKYWKNNWLQELKRNQYGFVAVGSGTDAYIHHEEKYRLTEGMLQLLTEIPVSCFHQYQMHIDNQRY